MAIEKGVTEVADSEDDPMTSSPGVVSDTTDDKLCAASCVSYQERQDALHEADGLHQAFAERDASANHILDGDLIAASVDVDASRIHQTDTMLDETAQEEGATAESGSRDLELHSQLFSPQPKSATRDTSDGSADIVVPAKDAEAVVRDVELDPTAGCEEQHFTASDVNSASAGQDIPEVGQSSIADASSKVPCAAGGVPLYTTVDSDVPIQSTYQLQNDAVDDSPIQVLGDDVGRAAGRDSVNGHLSENIDHSVPASSTLNIEGSTSIVAAGAPEDTGGEVPRSSVAQATTIQGDYTSSKCHGAQYPVDTLRKSQMDIDTSESAIIGNEASSMIDQGQTSRRNPAEQRSSVGELPLSKESADRSFDASSPITPAAHAQPHTVAQPMQTPMQTPPSRTPQEITLDGLRAQKAALLESLGALPAIQVLMEENALSDAESGDANDEPTESDIFAAANKIVKEHIKLLHEYNELKDVGQGLMGLIADQRGVRIVEVQEEFGIDAQD